MTNLNLDRDEAIVLESEEILRLKQDDDYDELNHVVLTNKKLYGSYEKSNGLFKKSTQELCVWPLSDIKIINGQAQVQQITYSGELCIRIQFMKETVYLAFSDNPEETMLQWILEINNLLGTVAITPPPKPPKEKKIIFARKRTNTADGSKNVSPTADNPAMEPSVEQAHTVTMDHTVNYRVSHQHQQVETEQPPAGGFCVNCGNRLTAGTIFCPICGFKVTSTKDSVTAPPTPPAPSIEGKVNRAVKPEKVEEKHDSDMSKKPTGTYTQRQQGFAGKIIKCPNCGEVLESFTSKCPSCGCEIRERTAVASVKELFSNIQQAKSDKEIIRLIKTFPIPNSKEDILEFMVLASSNFSESYYVSHLGEDNISDAWLSKAEQCYQKAQLTLSGTDILKIEDIYASIKARIAQAKRKFDNDQLLQKTEINAIEFRTSRFRTVLIVATIISAIFCALAFKGSKVFAGILAILMTALFLVAFLMGNGVIKEKVKNSRLIPAILAFLLIIPFFSLYHPTKRSSPTGSNKHSVLDLDDYKEDVEPIDWGDFILGEHIPDFGYDEAEIVWDNENVLILYFYSMNNSKFESYIEECKNFGYTIDPEESEANYMAYNQDGYYLHLQYLDFADDKKLTIDLERPIKSNQISWPESDLVKDLPVPKTLIGEVSSESSESYSVSITGIEPAYFAEYVSLCMDSGFNVDYSKSDTYFSAENKDGISLSVKYKGFNTLSIYIHNYDW